MLWCFFFQAEDGIRDLVRSRGLGDVYKRQGFASAKMSSKNLAEESEDLKELVSSIQIPFGGGSCLLYTSDAADERSSVDLGGRRIIKKKNN